MKKIICLIVILSTVNFIFAQSQYFQSVQEKKTTNNGLKYLGGFFGQVFIGIPLAVTTIVIVSAIPDVGQTTTTINWNDLFLPPSINTSTSKGPGNLEKTLLILLTPTALTYGTALGTYWVGKWKEEEGSLGGAFVGAGIGYISGILLGAGTAILTKNAWPVLLPAFTGPAGAVIGYNLSRHSGYGLGYNDSKFGLPRIVLKQELSNNGIIITILDLKLINTRF